MAFFHRPLATKGGASDGRGDACDSRLRLRSDARRLEDVKLNGEAAPQGNAADNAKHVENSTITLEKFHRINKQTDERISLEERELIKR